MTTTDATQLGVVQFMPIQTFNDPKRGRHADVLVERIVDDLLSDGPPKPPKAQSIGDWPRGHTAIRRGGFFVIETSMPGFTAMLRFSPEQPDAGYYEIHRRPRGGVETVRTLRLKAVPADETDARVSMLTPFQVRYFIVTGANDRARTELAWLVGLTSFREVCESA